MTHSYTVRAALRDSPTMSAAAMAAAAAARGRKVEIATIGDLFPKPDAAEVQGWLAQLIAAAGEAANHGDPRFDLRPENKRFAYSETTGLPSLRAAAAAAFATDTGMQAGPSEVMIGTGGKGALNGALQIFAPGDKVLLAAPGWPTNYDMFPAGVVLVEVATPDGLVRAAHIQDFIRQHGEPAAVLINAPSNPTGANYTPAEREALCAVLREHTQRTLLLSDDPYGKLVFGLPGGDSSQALRRGEHEQALFASARLAVFRTVSKEYGLAGLRVGFLITRHRDMLASLKQWNECKGGGMGVEDQLKAQAALMYGASFITRSVALLEKKRAILIAGIGGLTRAAMQPPQGTIYGWVDFAGLRGAKVPAASSETGQAYVIDTPADMLRYLVHVAGVCGVSGAPFYAPDSPAAGQDWHVRISFCGEEAQLQQLVANLQAGEALLA